MGIRFWGLTFSIFFYLKVRPKTSAQQNKMALLLARFCKKNGRQSHFSLQKVFETNVEPAVKTVRLKEQPISVPLLPLLSPWLGLNQSDFSSLKYLQMKTRVFLPKKWVNTRAIFRCCWANLYLVVRKHLKKSSDATIERASLNFDKFLLILSSMIS